MTGVTSYPLRMSCNCPECQGRRASTDTAALGLYKIADLLYRACNGQLPLVLDGGRQYQTERCIEGLYKIAWWLGKLLTTSDFTLDLIKEKTEGRRERVNTKLKPILGFEWFEDENIPSGTIRVVPHPDAVNLPERVEPRPFRPTGPGLTGKQIAAIQKKAGHLPDGDAARKALPLATGCLDYFPKALLAVAQLSQIAMDQHNPGKPLFWDRTKSKDEDNCLIRHFADRGTRDTDKVRHRVKVAWRALASLQKEMEADPEPLDGVL